MKRFYLYITLPLILILFGCESSEETQYYSGKIFTFNNDLNSIKRKPEKVKKLNIHRLKSNQFPSSELVELKNLEKLSLINNPSEEFEPTDSILEFDIEILKSLTSIKSITIVGIGFDHFPIELANIPNLEYLSIICGNIDSMPTDLSDFKSLKRLDLSINRIRTLPQNIISISPIELIITNNLVQSIPETFLEDSRLKSLDISNREGSMTTLPNNQLRSEDKHRLFALLKEGKTQSIIIQNLTCDEYEKIEDMFKSSQERKKIRTIEKEKNCTNTFFDNR